MKIGIIGNEEQERVESERVDSKIWKKPVGRTFREESVIPWVLVGHCRSTNDRSENCSKGCDNVTGHREGLHYTMVSI